MDKYEELDALADRLFDVEVKVEDLESSAATLDDELQLARLVARRDELRAAVDGLRSELHRLAIERLLDALAVEAGS